MPGTRKGQRDCPLVLRPIAADGTAQGRPNAVFRSGAAGQRVVVQRPADDLVVHGRTITTSLPRVKSALASTGVSFLLSHLSAADRLPLCASRVRSGIRKPTSGRSSAVASRVKVLTGRSL